MRASRAQLLTAASSVHERLKLLKPFWSHDGGLLNTEEGEGGKVEHTVCPVAGVGSGSMNSHMHHFLTSSLLHLLDSFRFVFFSHILLNLALVVSNTGYNRTAVHF